VPGRRGTPELAVARSSNKPLRPQLIQQRLRLLQIAGIETFRKPPVYRSQQFARLLHPALVAPEALRRSINHACSCEISRLVWSGMSTVAMKLTMAQAAM
jgi:hypothetical protein